jgi:hypothetical protein
LTTDQKVSGLNPDGVTEEKEVIERLPLFLCVYFGKASASLKTFFMLKLLQYYFTKALIA